VLVEQQVVQNLTLLSRCKHLVYCDNSMPMISEIFNDADDSSFEGIMKNNNHVSEDNCTHHKMWGGVINHSMTPYHSERQHSSVTWDNGTMVCLATVLYNRLWKYLFIATLFWRAIVTHKVGQTDLVFGERWGFISVQDYKFLCAGVTLCATIVAWKFDFYILTP